MAKVLAFFLQELLQLAKVLAFFGALALIWFLYEYGILG